MKVIFLDIDGVINTTAFTERVNSVPAEYPCNDARWGATQVDGVLLERIKTIVKRTGAVVVLHSSWRVGFSLEYLRTMLAGLDVLDVTGKGSKAASIEDWVENNLVECVAILDDVWLSAAYPQLKINGDTGITDDDVEMAVKHLGEV